MAKSEHRRRKRKKEREREREREREQVVFVHLDRNFREEAREIGHGRRSHVR